MFVLALSVELHLPECRSLKAKRSVLKPVTEGARRRYNVAVAETDHQNTWQRASVGVAAVGATASHAQDVIDEVRVNLDPSRFDFRLLGARWVVTPVVNVEALAANGSLEPLPGLSGSAGVALYRVR